MPWREVKSHEASNLIALCPNHHQQADSGQLDRATLLSLKAQVVGSQLHERVEILLEPAELFDPHHGPGRYPMEIRTEYIVALDARSMLAGRILPLNWPLIRCDICERIVSADRGATPQDDCSADHDEPMRVYCAFGCAQEIQRLLRESVDPAEFSIDPPLGYYLQNTVEMTMPRWMERRIQDLEPPAA